MKRVLYMIIASLVATAISFSVGQFFKPYLAAAQQMTDVNALIGIMEFLWQFLLLGFVIGGVIFTIPRNQLNEDYLKLSGMFCILGSAIMVAIFGFGIAAKATGNNSVIILIVSQLGLILFYTGIAILIIELIKECCRCLLKFYRK